MTRREVPGRWEIAVYCDADEHDPAKRPRILTAEGERRRDGAREWMEWTVTLHGGHWQTIRDGKRIDKRRHYPMPERLYADLDGTRRAVLRCRECDYMRPIVGASEHLDIAFADVCSSRKKAVRMSTFDALLVHARTDVIDDA